MSTTGRPGTGRHRGRARHLPQRRARPGPAGPLAGRAGRNGGRQLRTGRRIGRAGGTPGTRPLPRGRRPGLRAGRQPGGPVREPRLRGVRQPGLPAHGPAPARPGHGSRRGPGGGGSRRHGRRLRRPRSRSARAGGNRASAAPRCTPPACTSGCRRLACSPDPPGPARSTSTGCAARAWLSVPHSSSSSGGFDETFFVYSEESPSVAGRGPRAWNPCCAPTSSCPMPRGPPGLRRPRCCRMRGASFACYVRRYHSPARPWSCAGCSRPACCYARSGTASAATGPRPGCSWR